MKKLIVLSVLAGAAWQIAKRYDIKSLDDLKKLVLPKLEELKNFVMPATA